MPLLLRYEVLCSCCGEPLDEAILAELWEDRDFVEHAPYAHYASFDATAANFAAARAAYYGSDRA